MKSAVHWVEMKSSVHWVVFCNLSIHKKFRDCIEAGCIDIIHVDDVRTANGGITWTSE